MSALPKRVQRELDAANAAEIEFAAARQEAIAQAIPSVAALQTTVDTPPVATPPAAPTPVPPAPPKEDFEQKYKVLQGMYAADVTRVKAQVSDLATQLATLKEVPAAPPQPAQLDQKDVETFGADLIEMVRRYAEGQQAGTNQRLDALEQKLGMVAQRAAANSETSFFERLERAIPDINTINVDPRWLAWLGEPDDMSGEPRQAALDKAQQRGDVPRIAKIVKAFKADLPPPPQPNEGLQELVVPTGAGSPPLQPQAPKPILSSKAVNDFYLRVGRGYYAGNEAEMNRLEAEINLAAAENRIR